MGNVIFKCVSVTLSGITPIVLGNELQQAAVRGLHGTGRCLRRELTPRSVELPSILGRLDRAMQVDAVLRWKAEVVLLIRKPGNLRDCPPGHDFGDKDDASPVLVPGVTANIEPQVDLVEIGVKRNGKRAEEFCPAKLKGYQANVGSSIERIQDGTSWDVTFQEGALNFVIQHH
jgi:hypothetical protein